LLISKAPPHEALLWWLTNNRDGVSKEPLTPSCGAQVALAVVISRSDLSANLT